ncbi:MAG: hypothetical protein KC684_02375 [Candidatus Omnitrophica bacterium]|nr:hypothetical protein [Candidatus Omnitrophota bacterium]
MASDYNEEQLKKAIREVMQEEKVKAKESWYHKPVSIWGGFLVLGPFVLPLVWSHPKYSVLKKIVISIIMIVVTILLIVACAKIIDHFYSQAREILDLR